jgi:hypothetical protein
MLKSNPPLSVKARTKNKTDQLSEGAKNGIIRHTSSKETKSLP